MQQLLFVRHAAPVLAVSTLPSEWPLSEDGHARAVELGGVLRGAVGGRVLEVVASAETKAVRTAELLGLGPVRIDERLGEVQRPWTHSDVDFRNAVADYLSGRPVAGWEPAGDAAARFGAAVAMTPTDALFVTHGTILALWLDRQIDGFDPVDFARSSQMPDAFALDNGRLRRVEIPAQCAGATAAGSLGADDRDRTGIISLEARRGGRSWHAWSPDGAVNLLVDAPGDDRG